MKRKVLSIIAIISLSSISLNAGTFWVTGKITRTLIDHYYGGGMILLDRNLGNGCTGAWVSLDLVGRYWSKEQGKNKFSSALTAFAMDKKVVLQIYSHQKHSGYCVARRIDIVK